MTLTAHLSKVQDPQQKIKAQAMYYLAKREYSAKELLHKLEFAFPDQNDLVKTVLTSLQVEGALNNDRFLESRVRHRLAQGYGPLKIQHELKIQHGFDDSAIREALAHTEVPLKTQIEALIDKKFPHFDPKDPLQKNRVIRFLMQRGFSYSILTRIFLDE